MKDRMIIRNRLLLFTIIFIFYRAGGLTQTSHGTDDFTFYTPPTEKTPLVKSSRIVYLAGTGEHRDLFIMNEDGSDKKQLTKTEFSPEWPSWSPDGKHIMFVTYDEAYLGLYITDNFGENIRKVSVDAEMTDLPCWSHDSKRIAFMAEGEEGIKIADTEGLILRTVAGKEIRGAYPHWSPVEARLVFESGRDGNPEIYTINANQPECRFSIRQKRIGWQGNFPKITAKKCNHNH